MGCLICERIEQIKRGENPYFVCELSTGYVVLGDHQRFCGYTLFLSKQHVTELYHLPWEIRTRFLQEMSLVAGDTPQPGPVWWLPREEMWNDAFLPTPQQLAQQTCRLREEIIRRSRTAAFFCEGEARDV